MKHTLLFIACVMTSLTMSAQEGLAVEDLQNSGCLWQTRGEVSDPVPTIVLQKEGNTLSVQLLNYESNCATEGFVVKDSLSEGSNGIPSLTVDVYPYWDMEADCICPYNVSFTLRGLETNTFYLKCWWYEGQVTLEEGKSLVLEDITLDATIDGVNYTLKKTLGTATMTRVVEQKNKMIIPTELNYDGQTYTVTSIYRAFVSCTTIKTLDIPESVSTILGYSFVGCKLDTLIIRGILDPIHLNNDFFSGMGTDTKLYVQPSEVEKYEAIYKGPVYPLKEQTHNRAYRPMVEDGKVWKVGGVGSNPVQLVEYCYFDGDTIIDGKTCKQMMCQRYVNAEHPDYAVISQYPMLRNVGAWYEEDKKVFIYDTNSKRFKKIYDFSVDANDILLINSQSYMIGPRQTGGINGFKGVYRDVWMLGGGYTIPNTTWLEGVGGIDGPTRNVYYGEEGHPLFLMSCAVGDEVIYLNDEYEDGATPDFIGAWKNRFDFTHTIKIRPKAPTKNESYRRQTSGGEESGQEQSMYGEYSNRQLNINLDPLNDAYQVRITDESGKVVYEKDVNTANIVGLDIDISAYAKGRYTVTIENDSEIFTGEFETQTSGIEVVGNKKEATRGSIYNLQGQRIGYLQKGLNIVNGQKVYVK